MIDLFLPCIIVHFILILVLQNTTPAAFEFTEGSLVGYTPMEIRCQDKSAIL